MSTLAAGLSMPAHAETAQSEATLNLGAIIVDGGRPGAAFMMEARARTCGGNGHGTHNLVWSKGCPVWP